MRAEKVQVDGGQEGDRTAVVNKRAGTGREQDGGTPENMGGWVQ